MSRANSAETWAWDLQPFLHSKQASLNLERSRVLLKEGRAECVADEGKRSVSGHVPIANIRAHGCTRMIPRRAFG